MQLEEALAARDRQVLLLLLFFLLLFLLRFTRYRVLEGPWA